jgi:hypothetical protein
MHYRAFFTSKDFLTAADLYDERTDSFRELEVEITKVTRATLTGPGGKKDGRPGLYLRGAASGKDLPKPLGANATNCAAIANVARSTDMKDWPGTVVSLYVDTYEDRVEGPRPCLRIRAFAPTQQRAARGSAPQPQRSAAAAPLAAEAPTGSRPLDDEEKAIIAERERQEARRG